MGGKAAAGVAGYRYMFALHMGVCRGPVDELVEIRVGDLTAWSGIDHSAARVQADTDSAFINAPGLFGGDDKEGGIKGGLSVLMGRDDQDITTRTVQHEGHGVGSIAGLLAEAGMPNAPSFRGVLTLFFRGIVATNNPYPKAWKMRVRRVLKGWDGEVWYPSKALVILDGTIHAMNGAHILYECITNRAWGRGMPASVIDQESWVSSANTLCDEGFGLCLRWTRSDDLDAFMGTVLNHIGGAIFTDRLTGKLKLRLIRDNYSAGDIPTFTMDSGLLSVEQEDTGSDESAYNEIIVTYKSPIDGDERKVRAHNLAAIQSTGTIISTDVDYSGVPTAELATRLALRDLGMQVGLKRYTIKLDRRGWKIEPASVIRISYPPRDISNLLLRVGKIEDSAPTDGTITVTAVMDVFGLPQAGFAAFQDSVWTPPDRTAYASNAIALVELSYRELVRKLTKAEREEFDATTGAIGALAAKPSALSVSFELLTASDGEELTDRGVAGFTASAVLAASLTPLAAAATFSGGVELDGVKAGQAAWINDEFVRVDAIDTVAHTLTIARGAVDTIPATHAAGSRIWFVDTGGGTDEILYAVGETVAAKFLTNTNASQLAEADATLLSLTISGRQALPYPPGNVLVNGDPWFTPLRNLTHDDVVLTWTHRNRITQADTLLEHGAASVTPEVGTTYTVRVFHSEAVVRTESGIAGTSWTYTAAMIDADGEYGVADIELVAVRDGLESWQSYRVSVTLAVGFNHSFNLNFNGA